MDTFYGQMNNDCKCEREEEIWKDKRLLTDLLKERLREWPNGPNICVSPPPLTKSFRKRFSALVITWFDGRKMRCCNYKPFKLICLFRTS